MKEKFLKIRNLFSDNEYNEVIPKINYLQNKKKIDMILGIKPEVIYDSYQKKILLFSDYLIIDETPFYSNQYGVCVLKIIRIDNNGDLTLNKEIFEEFINQINYL